MNTKLPVVPRLRFHEFGDEWQLKKINSILTIGSGRDYKHLKPGNVPVYGTGGRMLYVDDYLYDGKSIGIGRKGTIDKPQFLEGKFWTVDTLFYTHSYRESIPEFIYTLFQRINWKQHNEASGVPSLSKNTINNIKITIPSEAEQQKIANFLTIVDEKIANIDKKVKLMKNYKKSVMQKIFTQSIRFKDEDGNSYQDWQTESVDDIFTHLKGTGLSKDLVSNDGKFKCILYGELYTTYVEQITNIVGRTNCAQGTESKVGDLLIPASTTTSAIDLAKVSELKEEGVLLGGDITIMRLKDKGSSTFFAYYLTHYKKREIAKYAQGSTIVHLYYSHFKKVAVEVPCFEEQQKIAAFLTITDQKIIIEEARLSKAKDFKNLLLQKMFI